MGRDSLGVVRLAALIAVLSVAKGARSQELNCPKAAGNWVYCESRPGLRQEGQPIPMVGTLSYRKEPLPQRIQREGVRMTTPIGTFRYHEREDQLSSGGWLVVDDRTAETGQRTDQGAIAETLDAWFYNATFDGRKPGTPHEWVYVEVRGDAESLYWTQSRLMYWADPTKLDRLPLE